MNQELLRIVDNLARDKNIDKETVFEDLEAAMLSAIRKANMGTDDVLVKIDRQTGAISAAVDGKPMSIRDLGRIAAQTAKQVMIQRIREAERDSIFDEYLERKGQIVTGRSVRWEGGSLVVDLGRVEAILPKSEQIPGESHGVEERIRAMVLDVREHHSQVKVILSRTHPDFIRALFELEVPEIAEGLVEIRSVAREAGFRSKVAVASRQDNVDPVGACVGHRGSRVQAVVDEMRGEKIDIVRWSDDGARYLAAALSPARISEVILDEDHHSATVIVPDSQQSLAIGKEGQNVRLAARLTGWRIDIRSESQVREAEQQLAEAAETPEAAGDTADVETPAAAVDAAAAAVDAADAAEDTADAAEDTAPAPENDAPENE